MTLAVLKAAGIVPISNVINWLLMRGMVFQQVKDRGHQTGIYIINAWAVRDLERTIPQKNLIQVVE